MKLFYFIQTTREYILKDVCGIVCSGCKNHFTRVFRAYNYTAQFRLHNKQVLVPPHTEIFFCRFCGKIIKKKVLIIDIETKKEKEVEINITRKDVHWFNNDQPDYMKKPIGVK